MTDDYRDALMRAIELAPNAQVANELSRWLGNGEIAAIAEDGDDQEAS